MANYKQLTIQGKPAIAACCNVVAEYLSTTEHPEDVTYETRNGVEWKIEPLTHTVRCPNYDCRRTHVVHESRETKSQDGVLDA